MPSPKSTYSFRLSDASIKKLQYCGNKLRPKGQLRSTLTDDLENTIDKLHEYLRQGPELFR